MNCTIETLLETAERLGLPRHYASDLAVDKRFLDGEFGEVPPMFGWVIYDCGTHLVRPDETDNSGRSMLQVFRTVFRTMFNTDRRCFVWTGAELKEMKDADAMIDYLESYAE